MVQTQLKMYLKQKRNYFAVFLLFAAATLAAGFPQKRSPPKLRRMVATQRASQYWFRHLEKLPHMDKKGTATSTSGEKTPSKAREWSREWVYLTAGPPAEDCIAGDVELAKLGRFYVSGRLEVYIPSGDHQRDTVDSGSFSPPVSFNRFFFALKNK